MNAQDRITVTAAEFTRQFGQLRQAQGDLPVFVTHHGRETHVLMPARAYEALQTGNDDDGRATPMPAATELANVLPHGVLLLDASGVVFAANQAAGAMLGRDAEMIADQPFASALPQVAVSPVGSCIRRAVESGEPQRADLPSPAREGRWLQVTCHSAPSHTMVLLHDITDEVVRHRLADRRAAAARALMLHHHVGEIVLSVRGRIEAIDPVVTGWLGLPPERFDGVALADLVPTCDRPAYREALEQVLNTGDPAQLSTRLLCNNGSLAEISATMVALQGTYGSEGALLIVTRD